MRINLLRTTLLLLVLNHLTLWAQKPSLDHRAYPQWLKLEKEQINASGTLVSYELNTLKGDPTLYWYDIASGKLDSMRRAKEALLAPNGSYIAWKVSPAADSLRQLELDKVDKKKWPKDSLFIYWRAQDSLVKIPNLKQLSQAKDADVLAYLVESKPIKATPVKKSFAKQLLFWKEAPKAPEAPKSDGHQLCVLSGTKQGLQLLQITQFSISANGEAIAVVRHQKDKSDSAQVLIYNPKTGQVIARLQTHNQVQNLNWNQSATALSYLFSDDTAKVKNYQLGIYELESKKQLFLGDSLDFEKSAKGTMQQVSPNRSPQFSADGKYLYFGVCPRSVEEKDSLLDSEKVKVDIWHYQDHELQAQQLLSLSRDLKRSDLYVYHLESQRLVKLGNDTLHVQLEPRQKGPYLLATSSEAYAIETQWKSPSRTDYYRISVNDGSINLLAHGIGFAGELSATGRYFTYYSPQVHQWLLLDNETETLSCMNCRRKDIVWNEDLNGQPMEAGPVGFIGYNTSENEVYFKSEYDIWSYDILSKNLHSLSADQATKQQIDLQFNTWQSDSIAINLSAGYVIGQRQADKNELLYTIENGNLVPHLDIPYRIAGIKKAAGTNAYLFRKMNVSCYPDLYLLDAAFAQDIRLSHANPQQDNYNWATVETVKWKAYDGQQLEGLLYKPENYDATKQYPLLLYYYELSSTNLHNYQSPKPSASTINPTEYASAGYLVFVPDIRYKAGEPAKSAYNAIMSATDYLLKHYPIDSTRMGLQGQSWGGYQTAMLITMTKRYAAAMAGAPVGNMFSAYGGIRWGSGISRQFQYESTQSRIGATIWEKPERYIENSPLFHLPNVQTPLLIMANDHDGAVPWYQGIELYTGLRRLGKPCWMLNYNDDDHNLTKLPYKIDLSIRMRQFFDHYLLGTDAPSWMTNGIPAIEKGKTLGYE
ncbi:MAG: hypothetical protein RLZZ301_387 [Bacteroidota bacterium]